MTFPLFQFANLSLVLTPIERRHGRQHGRCQAAGSGSGSGADSVSQIRQAPLHSTPICTRCLPTNPICNLPPISYRSPPPRPFPIPPTDEGRATTQLIRISNGARTLVPDANPDRQNCCPNWAISRTQVCCHPIN